MFLVKPSYEILAPADLLTCPIVPEEILTSLERYARTCYKSEDKISPGSARKLVRKLVTSGHHSQLEHVSLTVKFIIDRGVSHELVRHRLASFSQESTRYCNYAKRGVVFVIPPWLDLEPGHYIRSGTTWLRDGTRYKIFDPAALTWLQTLAQAEMAYMYLLAPLGWTPQQARSVLPNALKTEIVVTANLREWRHILALRTSPKAHPQIREVMVPLLEDLAEALPEVFDHLSKG